MEINPAWEVISECYDCIHAVWPKDKIGRTLKQKGGQCEVALRFTLPDYPKHAMRIEVIKNSNIWPVGHKDCPQTGCPMYRKG